MLDQKRLMICALSLLLVFSLVSMTAGTALRAGGDSAFSKMDTAQLLRHATKVEKNYLRSRMLEDNNGSNDGEEDNNEEDNENENENSQDEEEDADDENEEEEDRDDNEEDEEAEEEEAEEAEEEENKEEDAEEEENDDAQKEEDEAQNDDEEEANEEEADEEEEQEAESADQEEPHIDFLKCVAMTIEPNVVDVDAMLENGEIDEDEAAEIKTKYITEMKSNLNTQESIVFFTFGNGPDDEDRELFMVSINDWIAASSGYDQTCNAVDEDDVEAVFSKLPFLVKSSMVHLKSTVTQYSNHAWYSGFNCKADGTGFKPQLFLDETCNTFSPTLNQYYPFRKATTENNSTQINSDFTKYMIENANDSVQNSQYCDESEFCDYVFKKSVELATCEAGDEGEDKSEDEEGDENEDEDRDEDGDEDEDDKRRNLAASYQLEYDAASNIEDACPSIQGAFNINEEYEFSIDEIEKVLFLYSNTRNGGQESDRRSIIPGTNNGWLHVVGLLAAVFIATFLCQSRTKNPFLEKSSSHDTDDTDGSDTKREPLVDKTSASMPLSASDSASEPDVQTAFSAIECTLQKKKEMKKSEKRKSKTTQFRQYLKNSSKSIKSTSTCLSVESLRNNLS
jgi:hypothetical protein